MIDLAKPYGVHEGIVFYGDHEQNDLVYYFPDEVSLKPDAATGLYDLAFQIFQEGGVVEGDADVLRKSAGSILSLGVQCAVSSARLTKAIKGVKDSNKSLPDKLNVSLPLWKDGSVDLMVLDSITSDKQPVTENSFVQSIVGSHKPALMSGDLTSVFNVRLSAQGTSFIYAALNGDTGNLAGVLYDLKFDALRPALDLKIWADLDRCFDSVSHSLGFKAEYTYVVKFSLGAELEWLTQKLEEEGHLKVEVINQAEDDETKKMMDDMVKEFKESVLRELFRPYVTPSTVSVPNVESLVPVVGVSYKFKTEHVNQGKIMQVDYRERSTTTKTHNPQSHLWVFGKQIGANLDRYVQHLTFNDLWQQQTLTVRLENDFTAADNDLLSAEIIVWRKKDGVADKPKEGLFSLPANTQPLLNFIFDKDDKEHKPINWVYDRDEPRGYYYQIRFTYTNRIANIGSPKEIITPPLFATTQDIPIFPETYTFYKRIEVRQGAISFDEFSGIDVVLKLKNAANEVLDTELITINKNNSGTIYTVRGKDKSELYVEYTTEFHFTDNRPSIKTSPVYLTDDQLIVNKPFQQSAMQIIPIINGVGNDVKEILLKISVQSPGVQQPSVEIHRIPGPPLAPDDINVKLNSANDTVTYVASAVLLKDGSVVEIGKGEVKTAVLQIDLNKTSTREIQFVWNGISPVVAGLKTLQLEFKVSKADGTEDVSNGVEFKGDGPQLPVVKKFDRSSRVEMRIIKRFTTGEKEKGTFEEVVNDVVTIKA